MKASWSSGWRERESRDEAERRQDSGGGACPRALGTGSQSLPFPPVHTVFSLKGVLPQPLKHPTRVFP